MQNQNEEYYFVNEFIRLSTNYLEILDDVILTTEDNIIDGKITRNSYIRVIRDGEIIANTHVDALKIQKDDKSEINYGYECGIKLKDATVDN